MAGNAERTNTMARVAMRSGVDIWNIVAAIRRPYAAAITRIRLSAAASVEFQIAEQQFTAVNEPVIKVNDAISFVVNCETQEEIDKLWEKLSVGGEEV